VANSVGIKEYRACASHERTKMIHFGFEFEVIFSYQGSYRFFYLFVLYILKC